MNNKQDALGEKCMLFRVCWCKERDTQGEGAMEVFGGNIWGRGGLGGCGEGGGGWEGSLSAVITGRV